MTAIPSNLTLNCHGFVLHKSLFYSDEIFEQYCVFVDDSNADFLKHNESKALNFTKDIEHLSTIRMYNIVKIRFNNT